MTMPDTSTLPENVDATYADDPNDPAQKAHQQHHDLLHKAVKAVIPKDQRAAANGVATLGADVRIPTAQLPPLIQKSITVAYTSVAADAGILLEFNSAGALTLTIPPNASVAFPIGTMLGVRQYGVGQVTIVAGTGVILRSRDGALKTAGQYAEATLTKRAADEWVLAGDLIV